MFNVIILGFSISLDQFHLTKTVKSELHIHAKLSKKKASCMHAVFASFFSKNYFSKIKQMTTPFFIQLKKYLLKTS